MNYFLAINICIYITNVWVLLTRVSKTSKSSFPVIVVGGLYLGLILWACNLLELGGK